MAIRIAQTVIAAMSSQPIARIFQTISQEAYRVDRNTSNGPDMRLNVGWGLRLEAMDQNFQMGGVDLQRTNA